MCSECFISAHRTNPFHWAMLWKDGAQHAIRVDICKLRKGDYAIPLGHQGRRCPRQQETYGDSKHGGINFTVVTQNGIHGTVLEMCACDGGLARSIQLLRSKLFPATTAFPITAFTFPFLRAYRILSFRTKCSAHDYLRAFQRLGDNLRPFSVAVSFLFADCLPHSQFRISFRSSL